jgi:hypothetical protein
VGVDPEEADFLLRLPEKAGDSGYGSGRYGVIAAEDEGELASIEALGYQLAEVFTSRRYLGEESCVLGAGVGQAFGLRDVDVAQIVHGETELGEAAAQTGYAQGGWSHIHASAALAEIEWRSDYGDIGGFHFSHR